MFQKNHQITFKSHGTSVILNDLSLSYDWVFNISSWVVNATLALLFDKNKLVKWGGCELKNKLVLAHSDFNLVKKQEVLCDHQCLCVITKHFYTQVRIKWG